MIWLKRAFIPGLFFLGAAMLFVVCLLWIPAVFHDARLQIAAWFVVVPLWYLAMHGLVRLAEKVER